MPKYSEKFLNDRNKIYQENNKLLDMLYAVYRGNFIQGQAKVICFDYNYKREIKKGEEIQLVSYTDNTFNNLFRKLEELNLIDRKRFKDTNNLCVSFKKGLISMILNIPQDKISANKNAMNNSTNEVFNLSLLKGYLFEKYFDNEDFMPLKNYNYNELIDIFKKYNTNIFLTDKDILNLYNLIKILSNDKYSHQSMQLQNITQKVNNINNVREIKNGNKEVKFYKQWKDYKERGQSFLAYDLITLKRRKIFINKIVRDKSADAVFFYIDICVLNNKYSYQKIYKDIGETITSMRNLLIGFKEKYKLIINIVGYNEEKMRYFYEEFHKKRKYKENGGGYYYESNKDKIGSKYIEFNFRYIDFEKYIGSGFTID